MKVRIMRNMTGGLDDKGNRIIYQKGDEVDVKGEQAKFFISQKWAMEVPKTEVKTKAAKPEKEPAK